MPTDQEYSISELADLAGVTPRTVRYYITIGLLPAPRQGGPRTTYGDDVLQRLRLIRKLQGVHLPLGEIGGRLQGLDDEAVEEALETESTTDAPDSALDYIRRLKQGAGRAVVAADPSGPAGTRPLRAALPAAPTSASKEPPLVGRTQWERVSLSDNVELHLRRPLSRRDNKSVDRLIRLGRELLEENEPS